ncbi:protein containg methyltransferase domain [Longilinea arvoryzae]|uniref:Protein containg methyltransferase domain n=2 Tax=Longilinea arvoryzae TaxID=360412 RepID=A0A0S7BDW7_9CHLR|nr:protein containg methyltransferase domain [Longilinea arvoryzae]
MSDDVSDIAAYYSSDPTREHTRLERHQLEYELTWRYLERYLPAQGSILEVGAATGRYTLELTRRGYAVTAVDLSADLLDACRQNLERAGLAARVTFALADARDLSAVPGTDFDAALLMGPLYHLILESDRRIALRQVYDRLKPGGLLVSAFISRLGILGDLMKDLPEWIDDPREVHALLEVGHRPDDASRSGFRGYFARSEEITPLHESAGFETLALAGSEPAISADDESYNRLEGERRRCWLDLLYAVSTEPSILAASRHLLYVGRKPAA